MEDLLSQTSNQKDDLQNKSDSKKGDKNNKTLQEKLKRFELLKKI